MKEGSMAAKKHPNYTNPSVIEAIIEVRFGVIKACLRNIPNVKIIASEPIPSKLDKFRKAGLIGCLNDTGLTSDNYKKDFSILRWNSGKNSFSNLLFT